MNRHIARLDLRPQQCGAEHDSHALGSHPVHLAMIYHSEKETQNKCLVNWLKYNHHQHQSYFFVNKELRLPDKEIVEGEFVAGKFIYFLNHMQTNLLHIKMSNLPNTGDFALGKMFRYCA